MKRQDEVISLQFDEFLNYETMIRTECEKSKEVILTRNRGIGYQQEQITIPAELIEKLHREIEIINNRSYICEQWAEYCEFVLKLEEPPELDPETIRRLSANETDVMKEAGADYDINGLWSCFGSVSEDLGLKEKEEHDL